jgi:putative component of membrane protein insertase Oxa1/YidC/SpoIIIJ protein YidD
MLFILLKKIERRIYFGKQMPPLLLIQISMLLLHLCIDLFMYQYVKLICKIKPTCLSYGLEKVTQNSPLK